MYEVLKFSDMKRLEGREAAFRHEESKIVLFDHARIGPECL